MAATSLTGSPFRSNTSAYTYLYVQWESLSATSIKLYYRVKTSSGSALGTGADNYRDAVATIYDGSNNQIGTDTLRIKTTSESWTYSSYYPSSTTWFTDTITIDSQSGGTVKITVDVDGGTNTVVSCRFSQRLLTGDDGAFNPEKVSVSWPVYNTAPYWITSANLTVDKSGIIAENTTSAHVDWLDGNDDEGDPITYKVYRDTTADGATLAYSGSALHFDDDISSYGEGVGIRYYIYMTDGSLNSETEYSAGGYFYKNDFTAGDISGTPSMDYTSTLLSCTISASTNTKSLVTNSYTLSCTEVTVTNGTLDQATFHGIHIGTDSSAYISKSDVITYFASANYQGILHFKVRFQNEYGTYVDKYLNVAVDMRTTPSAPSFDATPYTNSYSIGGSSFYLTNFTNKPTVGWADCTNDLGGTILYDLDYKVTTDSVWTNYATGFTGSTKTLENLPVPANGAAAIVYNIRVRSRMAYGKESSYTTCGTNITISRYVRPTITLDAKTRNTTSVDIELTINKNQSTDLDTPNTISTFTFNDPDAGTHSVGTSPSAWAPHFNTTTAGGDALTVTSSYTMTISFQDVAGVALSASAVTLDISIGAYTPMFSIREKGVGINSINDGTGNYIATIVGKVNSSVDGSGRSGYFKDGVEIGVETTLNPASLTVTYGTLDSGTYTDLANIASGIVQISEATGSNALQVNVAFASVATFNQVLIYGKYVGSSAHEIVVELYDYDASAYVQLGIMDNTTAYTWYSFPVYLADPFISGGGTVTVRFRHPATGVNTHDLYLDYVVLKSGFGGGGTGQISHSALAGLDHDDHTQYHNDTRGDARYQPLDATLTSLAAVAATAANDFIVATGTDAWIKKTLAETKAIIRQQGTDNTFSPDYVLWEDDFMNVYLSGGAMTVPMPGVVISSGTITSVSAHVSNHPGVVEINGSGSSGGGAYLSTVMPYLISGSEVFECIFMANSLTNATIRMGMHDATTSSDAVDGAYLEIDSSGVCTGKTASNSSRTSTGSTYTISTSTWYRLRIVVNTGATSVSFTIYSAAGSSLWTNTCASNIPTGAGREVRAITITATIANTSSQKTLSIDWVRFLIPKVYTR